MSDAADSPEPKGSATGRTGKPIMIGAGLALLLGAGGFYASFTGLLPGMAPGNPNGTDAAIRQARAPAAASRPATFLPVDPITINLGSRGEARHLRMTAQLEVEPGQVSEVTRLMPRIVDVLNTYLRAVDMPEIEEPAGLIRLRAQMLRRVQIVVGPGRVNDLLIMEFIFN